MGNTLHGSPTWGQRDTARVSCVRVKTPPAFPGPRSQLRAAPLAPDTQDTAWPLGKAEGLNEPQASGIPSHETRV